MVKNIKRMVLLLAGAMLMFVGCSNISSEITSSASADSGTVTIGLSEITDRAAMGPATLTVTSDEINHYKISGTSKNGLTFTATSLTKAAVSGGTASITNVPLDDWTFTLIAYADEAGTKPILQGTSTCNMKSANATSVSFTLSSYGLTTLGAYTIKIQYDGGAWKDDTYSFTWGLYDPITGNTMGTTGATAGSSVTTVGAGATEAGLIHTSTDYYSAQATGVTPGSYVFGVAIYSGSTKIGFASEGLIIEPGRTTTATLVLDNNIIQSAPTAPSGLIAQRIKDSENDDFYDVRFVWTDASVNEESFELVISKFTDTSTDWAVSAADATIENDENKTLYTYSSILELTKATDKIKYVSGSLYAGSKELVLRFPVGTLWDVQLRSVNSVGKSVTVGRSADSNEGTTSLTTSITPSSTTSISCGGKYVIGYGIGTSGENVHISLVKIVYRLDGGTLTIGGTAHTNKNLYVEYKPYTLKTNGDGDAAKYIALLTIADTTTLVDSSGKAFSKWISPESATSANPASITYNTNAYGNFEVIAKYGADTGTITVSSATIQQLAHELFTDTHIAAYYGTSATEAQSTNSCKNASIPIGWGAAQQYVTVKVTTNSLFSRYVLSVGEYQIEEKEYAETSINFSNFSTDRLAKGGASTCVRVDAYTPGGEMASNTFYIRIIN
ncbi:MAG: hypothetical protein K5829_08415 [Treponema sp.]|nr:hypothetical protein [Treponema sp.]